MTFFIFENKSSFSFKIAEKGSAERASIEAIEGLREEELELFDLIKKDKMTKEETQRVRLAAKSLLHLSVRCMQTAWSVSPTSRQHASEAKVRCIIHPACLRFH